MGLQVIAEGIEDLDQADWLLRHGCAMAQGFAFGRPAPLPGRTEALAEEITGAPPVPLTDQTPERLLAGIAAPELDRPSAGTGPLPVLPVPRGGGDVRGRHDDMVEASTGEFDVLPDDPEDH
jgi:hypothetical protein